VHVGATDARVVDCYEDIVRGLELRERSLLEADVVGLVEDEGKVLKGWVGWLAHRTAVVIE
jgi:hypothetical protein